MVYGDSLIDIEWLQKIQDSFCEVAQVCAFCVDEKGKRLTELSGNKEDSGKMIEMLSEERLTSVIDRMKNSDVEDQIVEEIGESGVKIAGISIKVHKKVILNWIVLAAIKGKTENYRVSIAEEFFQRTLDFIRIGSDTFFSDRADAAEAAAESRKSRFARQEMENALKKSEIMTDILQLMESDEGIEKLVAEILEKTSAIVKFSHAYVLRLNKDNETVDIVAEYEEKQQKPVFSKKVNIKKPDFLNHVDKTVTISSNNRDAFVLAKYGIKGIVMIPVMINARAAMYACFMECRMEREWQIPEIKFLNDVVKILQNIIVKRIQKNSLASSYESLEFILNHVGSGIYVQDKETHKILFSNSYMKENFSTELADGSLGELFQSVPVQRGTAYTEVYCMEQDRWYDLRRTYINWVDGRSVILNAIYDITDKKQYQKKIEQQANNDFLTGLYNRMCCEKDLARYIEESRKHDKKGALLYLDLDDFKHINDGLGHQYGDVLLKAISHSLQRIRGIEETCYRMGGDEFVIIVPDSEYECLSEILTQIRAIFEKPWFLKGADYYCTMSMGIVTFPDEGETVQDLVKKADIAMYEAKKAGKNQVARYAQESDCVAYRRLDMEKNMRAATATTEGFEEFRIYYQPLIDINRPGAPCVGAEALLRWKNEELGFISPADFIPLAEYLGLINPIGSYVLKKACEECRMWNENGHPYYKVNVNLSVVQLLQNNIVELIADVIKETGINPKNLTLEVTESLAINDMARMKEVLGNIRKLGARIALDDFGTGYSSLNYIREIPLDVIKVDQSFVRDLAINQYSQSFIKMVAELAQAIGVKVCVEGVEAESQLQVLKNMKVKLIQGYYFGKPMPKEEFERKYVFRDC